MNHYYPVIFFLLAALFGAWMFFGYISKNQNPPKLIVSLHGLFAVLGIGSLILVAMQNSVFWAAAVIFILAACGGLYMLSKSLKKEFVPKNIAAGHGLFALIGFTVLLILVYWHQ